MSFWINVALLFPTTDEAWLLGTRANQQLRHSSLAAPNVCERERSAIIFKEKIVLQDPSIRARFSQVMDWIVAINSYRCKGYTDRQSEGRGRECLPRITSRPEAQRTETLIVAIFTRSCRCRSRLISDGVQCALERRTTNMGMIVSPLLHSSQQQESHKLTYSIRAS